MQSANVERYTPEKALAFAIGALGGIDLDPCADPAKRVPAASHYTKDDDGLSLSWHGRVFVNPPFNNIPTWAAKGNLELERNHRQEQLWLVPNKQGTRGFRMLTRDSGHLWRVAVPKGGRYTFLQGDGTGRVLEPGEIGPNGKPWKPYPVMFDLAWVFRSAGQRPMYGGAARFIRAAAAADMLVLGPV